MPLVALIPVAVGSLRFRWARTDRATVPVALVLTPFLLVFCIVLTYRMY